MGHHPQDFRHPRRRETSASAGFRVRRVRIRLAMLAALLAGCGADPAERAADTTGDGASAAAPPASAPPDPDRLRTPVSGDGFDLTSIAPQDAPRPARTPDVVYVPTARPVVDAMLEIAEVGPDDVLYDLGSGDGRIPITAARRWGTRGVGVEIHPLRIREANRAAHRAGVADKVTFIEADLFEIDLSSATVVTLYLLPELNLRLRPRLLRLAPGTRIVTHNYHMGDWTPQRQRIVGDSVVYYWTVPERIPPHLR